MSAAAFFERTYAAFPEDVSRAVREAAFGEDIGQTSWVTVAEYAEFMRFMDLDEHARVLEVASGSGGPAIYLARETGCRVTGLDVDANGVRTATRAAATAGLEDRARFLVGDANVRLPFEDASFDALICMDSMNHLPDRARVLAEWFRVLRPGGRAVFTDPVVIHGAVTNAELAQRSAVGPFVFVPAGWNEAQIVATGFHLVARHDATENAALISARWRSAREGFADALRRIEGEATFAGVQDFLAAVHVLSADRRLRRIAYLVEKPGG